VAIQTSLLFVGKTKDTIRDITKSTHIPGLAAIRFCFLW
jgi:hypothetical protein